ncbi:Lrp/AsnC family transcriptional regulator [Asticcacaulis sp. BYS171W]|uniref:Lrp/AsnC family transcriptional regulator n=1 Tax=Asticcacaulis aquaticus TaxID=2984212 RepID=A0ABT5HPH4_9CAUL|nr:Lrp/AsnC family transcriptional regulator [Asticcacaulis aquaticus]MDC7681961.1 Lrp/AsnC family transcriptional regulator [Asticcacaulis aquaticus]
MKNFTPDAFDYAILEAVQIDNRIPLRELAERVNLSTAAVQRRIRRLEDEGVITRNIAVIEPHRVGLPITIAVEVTMERTHIDELDAMRALLTAAPEVQQCYYVTGEADFVLIVLVETMEQYEALARRLFYDNRNVKTFKSMVTLDRVKVGLSVDLSGQR